MRTTISIALMTFSAFAIGADDIARCKEPQGTRPFEFTYLENRLRGFIDVPPGPGPYAAVLVIHGSGDTDIFRRDSEYNGHYDILRSTFRSAGVATVIWDKAGNGCSTGGYSNGNPIRERAGETVAALRVLKERSDVDASRMGLWGISQGAWVAPMAAVRTRDVSFLILVSAPARDAVSQLEYQTVTALRNNGMAQAELGIVAKHLRRAFAVMRAGGSIEEFIAAVEPLKKYHELRDLGITTGTLEEYRAWQNSMDHEYRPDTALRELQQPVLAIFGDRDVLVDWRESTNIFRESFRTGGNDDLTIKVFRNADHNLFKAGSDSQFTEGYMQMMRHWLQNHAHKAQQR